MRIDGRPERDLAGHLSSSRSVFSSGPSTSVRPRVSQKHQPLPQTPAKAQATIKTAQAVDRLLSSPSVQAKTSITQAQVSPLERPVQSVKMLGANASEKPRVAVNAPAAESVSPERPSRRSLFLQPPYVTTPSDRPVKPLSSYFDTFVQIARRATIMSGATSGL